MRRKRKGGTICGCCTRRISEKGTYMLKWSSGFWLGVCFWCWTRSTGIKANWFKK